MATLARRLAAATTLLVLLGPALPAAAAPATMTREEILDLAISGVGYSYWWGNGCWRTDGAQHGSCSGNCPNCSHSGSYGADCSGYAAKVWQVPSPSAVSSCAHPYSTWHFTCTETWWDAISRGNLQGGDAASYRSGGCPGDGGHIVVFDRGDPWGSMWTYEARGCSYGIVHNSRTLTSSYRAIRRQRLGASCTPTTEVCNGQDDDCDGQTDEGNVCAEADETLYMQGLLDADPTTDVNGDGKADACVRAPGGFQCAPATGSGFGAVWTIAGLSDANGWNDPTNGLTVRLGDLDGDGKADVCARGNARTYCYRSTGSGFTTSFEGPTDMSDAAGFTDPKYYTTLRLADVTGDGKDDLCGRFAAGFRCFPSTGTGFGAALVGPELSDASGWGGVDHYATLRMGDVNGDGLADVCARGTAGMFCWLATGTGFGTRITGPAWSDDAGFTNIRYWSTIRLHDVNGDDRADLCVRTASDFRCHLSTGTGFGGPLTAAIMADANGWNDLTNYSTIRLGDIDGDGDGDVCARANARVVCWRFDGQTFGSAVNGPELSDDSGWDAADHYRSLRLADVNGDGKADLCARAAAGLRCWLSNGSGFPTQLTGPEWTDAAGFDAATYYPTLRIAGPRRPRCVVATEVCNGQDDDCDGDTDEGFASGEPCTVGSGACATSGHFVCRADGGVACDALPPDCDDGNGCTHDACDPEVGCFHTPQGEAAACDDGTACTTGDHCQAGLCVGTPLACDDGNACTSDACEPAMGCVFEPNADACDDGDLCTTGDRCEGGLCVGAEPLDCSDGDPCTADECDPSGGCASAPEPEGAPCDDGDPCTSGDRCTAGLCAGPPLDCEDGDPCTTEGCVAGECAPLGPVADCCHADADCLPGLQRCDTALARCVSWVCTPCVADGDCGAPENRCLPYPDGNYCGVSCFGDADRCGDHAFCRRYDPDADQCVPTSGDCRCTPRAREACVAGHVHWLDSCGQVGERAADCAARGCKAGACCPLNTTLTGQVCAPDAYIFGPGWPVPHDVVEAPGDTATPDAGGEFPPDAGPPPGETSADDGSASGDAKPAGPDAPSAELAGDADTALTDAAGRPDAGGFPLDTGAPPPDAEPPAVPPGQGSGCATGPPTLPGGLGPLALLLLGLAAARPRRSRAPRPRKDPTCP